MFCNNRPISLFPTVRPVLRGFHFRRFVRRRRGKRHANDTVSALCASLACLRAVPKGMPMMRLVRFAHHWHAFALCVIFRRRPANDAVAGLSASLACLRWRAKRLSMMRLLDLAHHWQSSRAFRNVLSSFQHTVLSCFQHGCPKTVSK